MEYEYRCSSCRNVAGVSFPMGEAPALLRGRVHRDSEGRVCWEDMDRVFSAVAVGKVQGAGNSPARSSGGL